MIVPRELALLIRGGRKTMLRVPVRHGEDCRYRPDGAYAIQPGPGKPAIAHIVVSDVRRERLGDITLDQAKQEGFRTRDEFLAHWANHHNLGLAPRYRDLLERLVDAPDTLHQRLIHPGLPAAALTRRLHDLEAAGYTHRVNGEWDITDKGADLLTNPAQGVNPRQAVWVLEFRLDDRDIPRLLAPAARPAGSDLGYVDRRALALPDEPEAINTDQLRPEWRENADRRHRRARAEGTYLEKALIERERRQAKRDEKEAA